MADLPRTVDQIYEDFCNRRTGLTKALIEDVDDFYQQCDPERENLCLYGEPNGSWQVNLPAEEVPPELPEPCLGINFARDGMQKKDWLALVAVHSDAWLLAVAFFYAVKLDQNGRAQLHKKINQQPTLFELVSNRTNKPQRTAPPPAAATATTAAGPPPAKRRKPETSGGTKQLGNGPTHPGRVLRIEEVTNALKGRQAELFWPDDGSWYEVEIQQVNVRGRTARILYTTGEVEELDLEEICKQGHMSLIL